jgi:hypothetical protein
MERPCRLACSTPQVWLVHELPWTSVSCNASLGMLLHFVLAIVILTDLPTPIVPRLFTPSTLPLLLCPPVYLCAFDIPSPPVPHPFTHVPSTYHLLLCPPVYPRVFDVHSPPVTRLFTLVSSTFHLSSHTSVPTAPSPMIARTSHIPLWRNDARISFHPLAIGHAAFVSLLRRRCSLAKRCLSIGSVPALPQALPVVGPVTGLDLSGGQPVTGSLERAGHNVTGLTERGGHNETGLTERGSHNETGLVDRGGQHGTGLELNSGPPLFRELGNLIQRWHGAVEHVLG